MQDIFWAPIDSNPDFSLAYEMPVPLSQEIPKNLRSTDYFRCPAFTDNLKNIFVLKSPIDAELELDKGNIVHASPNLYNKILPLQNNILQLKINNLFFTQKSCKIKMVQPFLHTNDFTKNGNTVYGEYDISKWLRPLQAAMIIHSESAKFTIKRGDPFAYVIFDTKEHVKLKPFDVTPNIDRILQKCLDMKFATSAPFSLDKCYKSFIMYRYSKAIISEIKANENTTRLHY